MCCICAPYSKDGGSPFSSNRSTSRQEGIHLFLANISSIIAIVQYASSRKEEYCVVVKSLLKALKFWIDRGAAVGEALEEEEVLVPIRRETFVAKTNTTTVAFEDYSRLTKR